MMLVRGMSIEPVVGHDPVHRKKVTIDHIAVGLWVGLAAVLLIPHPRGHKVKQEHINKSYGIAMSVFGLT